MSSIQYHLTLDLRRDLHQVLVMKEGDADSREIVITITDNGKIYGLSGYSADCKWRKPDGTLVFSTCSVSDNTVHILCTEQMLAAEGVSKAEIVLYGDRNPEPGEKNVISTMKFHVSISASVIHNGDIESTDEFSALTEIMLTNREFAESLKNLEETLTENEAQRGDAEETRKRNEEQRILNENERTSAENGRRTGETIRQEAEAERDTAEKNRESAENERKNAETARQENETARQENETVRQEAEEAREENISSAIENANAAIERMERLMDDSTLVHTGDLGVPNGAATLDEHGLVPSSQLPSYVDDVKDGHAVDVTVDPSTGSKSASGFILDGDAEPCMPETDKIYIDTAEGITYRWSGSVFVSIGSPLSLGTTSSAAFPGDRGLALEERMTEMETYHENVPASDIRFSSTSLPWLGKDVQTAIENLSQPATPEQDGLLSADDKKRIDSYADIRETEITLPAAGWTGGSAPYTQTVTVSGLSVYNNCSIAISPHASPEQADAVMNAGIEKITCAEPDVLVFTADGIRPSTDIPLLLCTGTSMNVVNVPHYLCRMPVTGVRGADETEYRYGNVTISAENTGAVPAAAVVNNDSTTSGGYVADARIVKEHRDEIDALKAANSSLNGNLANTYYNKTVVDGLLSDLNTSLSRTFANSYYSKQQINTMLDTTKSSATLTGNVKSNGLNSIKKTGNVVSVNLLLSGVNGSGDVILPEGFRPKELLYINVCNYDASGCVTVLMSCGTNGKITRSIPSILNKEYLCVDFSFIN